MVLRRIETNLMDAYANLALEEAIFRLNKGTAIRVWKNEKSVIIGRAQLASFETDLQYCESERIPVVRRFTAGGAVYNGPGNLNWSVFLSDGFDLCGTRFSWDARGVFKRAASVVVETLRRLGVRAWLDEPNRIVTEDGKVCGMAAYLAKWGLLCHGTMLLNADLEEAALLTRPRKDELDKRYVRSAEMRMANVGIKENAFTKALWDVLCEPGQEAGPSREELELADKLERYRDPQWNTGDPFEYGRSEN